MSAHTKARLVPNAIQITLYGVQAKWHAIGIEGTTTAVALMGLCGDSRDAASAADARRLAACWNACEGIDTDNLENFPGWIKNGFAPGVMVVAERDKLLVELAAANARIAAIEAEAGKRDDEWRAHSTAKALDLAESRALLGEVLAADDEAIADAAIVDLPFPDDLLELTGRIRAFLAKGCAQ